MIEWMYRGVIVRKIDGVVVAGDNEYPTETAACAAIDALLDEYADLHDELAVRMRALTPRPLRRCLRDIAASRARDQAELYDFPAVMPRHHLTTGDSE